ncbi:MAG: ORF6N domain-containing protein [Candidatus Scalindua sp.]|jgi:phage regulator Rha-like protein|nr:ORF6N domain-containing protein [Candidatus Scalindua sp.]MDV5167313.1 ORF6N domain-containing protein [Candidatus Scalindua sp.]
MSKEKQKQTGLISRETIEDKILLIRGKKIMLDSDLAVLYGVETKQLTRQVRRNVDRFPDDFMFRLTKEDFLRCQFGTSKSGGRRYSPYAFTEHGILMLSSVLNSERAIQVNIQIMRAFVKLRQIISTNKELVHKLSLLERKTEKHDTEIQAIFKAIRQLMTPPEKTTKRIGCR